MTLAAADIGGTKISLCLADLQGIRIRLYQPTRVRGDRRTVPRQVIELIEKACAVLGIEAGEVAALGVSAASPFTMRGGRRELTTLTLCGGLEQGQRRLPNDWTSIPLEEELGPAFPGLRLENDCVAAVVAERLFGAGRGVDNLAYVTWSTGIGAGAYVDGHLLKGKNGNAMHLGYLLLAGEGPPAGAQEPATAGVLPVSDDLPAVDRLEAWVGGPALEQRYGQPGQALFRDFREGKPRAHALVAWAARVFARGLVNLTSLLDPAVIVVGGAVAARNWDVLAPLVEKEYRSHYPVLTRQVQLGRSSLGEQPGEIGALSLVMPEEWTEAYRLAHPWTEAAPAIVLPEEE